MEKRYNVVFLMTDHQRADTIGMIQCGREITPNLNRLAESSTNFTRAYTTCPLCVPARTALATGIYPTCNQVVYNDWKGNTATDNETIHTLLKREGYRVGYIGVDHIKVKPGIRERNLDCFINQEDYKQWIEEQGITSERTEEDKSLVLEEVDEEYINRQYSNHHISKWPHEFERFKDSYFTQNGIKFLEYCKYKGDAFALFLYLWAPHPPLNVPEPYASMYNPEQINLPSNINLPAQDEPTLRRKGVPAQLADNTSIEEWKKVWAAHLGLMSMVDDLIGKVLDKLTEIGEFDNTIIIFTGDHGESLGQHKMYQKMEMYEEMINIPLIMKVPGGKIKTMKTPVSHLDVVPTLCELTKIKEQNNKWDGQSLVRNIFTGEEDEDRTVYSAYSGNPSYGTIRRAVITKSFKYVYDSAYEHELYDLEKDPLETKNLAKDKRYKELVEKFYQDCKGFNEERDDCFKWK